MPHDVPYDRDFSAHVSANIRVQWAKPIGKVCDKYILAELFEAMASSNETDSRSAFLAAMDVITHTTCDALLEYLKNGGLKALNHLLHSAHLFKQGWSSLGPGLEILENLLLVSNRMKVYLLRYWGMLLRPVKRHFDQLEQLYGTSVLDTKLGNMNSADDPMKHRSSGLYDRLCDFVYRIRPHFEDSPHRKLPNADTLLFSEYLRSLEILFATSEDYNQKTLHDLFAANKRVSALHRTINELNINYPPTRRSRLLGPRLKSARPKDFSGLASPPPYLGISNDSAGDGDVSVTKFVDQTQPDDANHVWEFGGKESPCDFKTNLTRLLYTPAEDKNLRESVSQTQTYCDSLEHKVRFSEAARAAKAMRGLHSLFVNHPLQYPPGRNELDPDGKLEEAAWAILKGVPQSTLMEDDSSSSSDSLTHVSHSASVPKGIRVSFITSLSGVLPESMYRKYKSKSKKKKRSRVNIVSENGPSQGSAVTQHLEVSDHKVNNTAAPTDDFTEEFAASIVREVIEKFPPMFTPCNSDENDEDDKTSVTTFSSRDDQDNDVDGNDDDDLALMEAARIITQQVIGKLPPLTPPSNCSIDDENCELKEAARIIIQEVITKLPPITPLSNCSIDDDNDLALMEAARIITQQVIGKLPPLTPPSNCSIDDENFELKEAARIIIQEVIAKLQPITLPPNYSIDDDDDLALMEAARIITQQVIGKLPSLTTPSNCSIDDENFELKEAARIITQQVIGKLPPLTTPSNCSIDDENFELKEAAKIIIQEVIAKLPPITPPPNCRIDEKEIGKSTVEISKEVIPNSPHMHSLESTKSYPTSSLASPSLSSPEPGRTGSSTIEMLAKRLVENAVVGIFGKTSLQHTGSREISILSDAHPYVPKRIQESKRFSVKAKSSENRAFSDERLAALIVQKALSNINIQLVERSTKTLDESKLTANPNITKGSSNDTVSRSTSDDSRTFSLAKAVVEKVIARLFYGISSQSVSSKVSHAHTESIPGKQLESVKSQKTSQFVDTCEISCSFEVVPDRMEKVVNECRTASSSDELNSEEIFNDKPAHFVMKESFAPNLSEKRGSTSSTSDSASVLVKKILKGICISCPPTPLQKVAPTPPSDSPEECQTDMIAQSVVKQVISDAKKTYTLSIKSTDPPLKTNSCPWRNTCPSHNESPMSNDALAKCLVDFVIKRIIDETTDSSVSESVSEHAVSTTSRLPDILDKVFTRVVETISDCIADCSTASSDSETTRLLDKQALYIVQRVLSNLAITSSTSAVRPNSQGSRFDPLLLDSTTKMIADRIFSDFSNTSSVLFTSSEASGDAMGVAKTLIEEVIASAIREVSGSLSKQQDGSNTHNNNNNNSNQMAENKSEFNEPVPIVWKPRVMSLSKAFRTGRFMV